jgi:hypothetical protein
MALVQLFALVSKPPTQYASALAMACQSMMRSCDETIVENSKGKKGSLMSLDVEDLVKS